MFGVTENGFVRKTLADIKADFQEDYKSIYGNPNFADDSVIGIRIGIQSKALADAWETLEAVYNAPFPSKADDGSIPDVLDLVGLQMLPAVKTLVTCTCSGTPSTVITAGSLVSNTNRDTFELTEEVEIDEGGSVDGVFRAIVTGPVAAPAGTVTSIQTPISGWDSVINMADGTIGRDAETTDEARVRRSANLQVIGASALDAVVARVGDEVDGITSVIGFENTGDVVDASGRPPHSIELVVAGGLNQDIADKIWECKSGGIRAYGNTDVTVEDSTGRLHTVSFSRATARYVHVEVTVDSYYDEENLPATGDNLKSVIKAAVLAFGQTLPLGKDLIIQRWTGPVISIAGIGSITVRHAVTDTPDGTASWSTSNVAIGETSKAEMSDSLAENRITVILP